MVRLGAERGFSLLAVTDHDTMDGVPEALAAGARAGVRVLPGVEISSGVALEVHLLGYGMSPDHPVMREMLEDMRRARVERMVRIIENLQGMGIPIEVEEVEALAGGAIGRPHIARVLVQHGVVPDVRTAFREYIGLGARAYAERRKMTSEAVIRNIRAAGGVPVLAHGGLLKLSETELEQWIHAMCGAGLMGLECYHNAHTPTTEAFLRRMARRYGLLVTAAATSTARRGRTWTWARALPAGRTRRTARRACARPWRRRRRRRPFLHEERDCAKAGNHGIMRRC